MIFFQEKKKKKTNDILLKKRDKSFLDFYVQSLILYQANNIISKNVLQAFLKEEFYSEKNLKSCP